MTSTPMINPDWGTIEYVTVADGASLLVRRSGPADAPILLCLASHGGNSREFARLAARHESHFQVISLDLRGHGGSDYLPQDTGYSQQQWITDLVNVIDHMGLTNIVGIGVSLGGMLLGMLHEQRPDLLQAAVIVDIGPEMTTPSDPEQIAIRMQKTAAVLGASYASQAETVTAWRQIVSDQWPNVADADWEFRASCTTSQSTDGRWRFDADIEGFMNRPPAQLPPDHWTLWRALSRDIPVMLVHGELSNVLSAEVVARMVEGTSVQLVTVPRIGHCPLLDINPVRDTLDQFIVHHAKSP